MESPGRHRVCDVILALKWHSISPVDMRNPTLVFRLVCASSRSSLSLLVTGLGPWNCASSEHLLVGETAELKLRVRLPLSLGLLSRFEHQMLSDFRTASSMISCFPLTGFMQCRSSDRISYDGNVHLEACLPPRLLYDGSGDTLW